MTSQDELWEDTIAGGVTMFSVFCTADIPPEVLNTFIHHSRSGSIAMYGGIMPSAHCILHSTDTSTIKHASRYPTQPFKSPFLGLSLNQIHNLWMTKIRGDGSHFQPDFSYNVYTVLDEQTAKDKNTCLVVCCHPRELQALKEASARAEGKARVEDLERAEGQAHVEGKTRVEDSGRVEEPKYGTVRTEFANSLYHAIKLEEGGETTSDIKADNNDAEVIKWEFEVTSAKPESWERLDVDGGA